MKEKKIYKLVYVYSSTSPFLLPRDDIVKNNHFFIDTYIGTETLVFHRPDDRGFFRTRKFWPKVVFNPSLMLISVKWNMGSYVSFLYQRFHKIYNFNWISSFSQQLQYTSPSFSSCRLVTTTVKFSVVRFIQYSTLRPLSVLTFPVSTS